MNTNSDLEVLRQSIQQPVQQMIVAQVTTSSYGLTVAALSHEWSQAERATAQMTFNANVDEPNDVFSRCHEIVQSWGQSLAIGLLILSDRTPDNAINSKTAAFWQGMNQLRESWDELSAQVIFLLTSDQYRLFTTEADHLRRWVSLKLRLEDSRFQKRAARRPRDVDDSVNQFVDSVLAEWPDTATAHTTIEVLQRQLGDADHRQESALLRIRRYYLPLMAAHLALGDLIQAQIVNQRIGESKQGLRILDKVRWLGLRLQLEEKSGDVKGAIRTAKERFRKSANCSEEIQKEWALWDLAQIYYRQQQYDEFERLWRQGIELYQHHSWLGTYANFLQTVRHDYDQAEKFYLRALESDPDRAVTLGNYASFLQAVRHDYDQAEKFYLRALESDPDRVTILHNYADFLSDFRNDYDKAEQFYLRALEVDPKHASTLGNYALFLKNDRQDYDQAEQFFLRALEVDPKHSNNLANYASFLNSIRQDYDQAEQFFLRALEVDPEHSNNLANYASFLSSIRQDYDQAERFFLRALEIDPKNVISLGSYALFLETIRQDYDQAENLYMSVLEINPDRVVTLGNYADFLETIRQDYDRAEQFYLRALEIDSDRVTILANYASFLSSIRQDYDQAEQFFLHALEIDPKNSILLVKYALFLSSVRQDYDQSEKFFLHALEIDPNRESIIVNYALFLDVIRHEYKKAEDFYLRALEIGPEFPGRISNYSKILLSTGNKDKGMTILLCSKAMIKIGKSFTVEMAFYCYAYLWREIDCSLSILKNLLTSGERALNWDVELGVERAIKEGHPEPLLLRTIANIMTRNLPLDG